MSSANTSSMDTCGLFAAKNTSVPYLTVVTVCPEDVKRVAALPNAMSCHHFILAIPSHISCNPQQKALMDSLAKGSYATEIQGVLPAQCDDDDSGNNYTSDVTNFYLNPTVISDMTERFNLHSCDGLFVNILSDTSLVSDSIFVYIDPAFTVDKQGQTPASRTGLAIFSKYKVSQKRCKGLLLSAKEIKLLNHNLEASKVIACTCGMQIIELLTVMPKTFNRIVVAVESNSNENAAFQITSVIKRLLNSYEDKFGFSVWFWHHRSKETMTLGYRLGNEKSLACSQFADDFNKRCVKLSMSMPVDDIRILSDQLKRFRPNGKPIDKSQDDVALSVIMAYHIMLNDNNEKVRNLILPSDDIR